MGRLGNRLVVGAVVAALATTLLSAARPGTGSAPASAVLGGEQVESRAAGSEAVRLRSVDRVNEPELVGDAVIAPPPERFDGPAARSGALPDELQRFRSGERRPGGGVWAVIIGVDDYPGTRSDLRSAVNDADDVDRALDALGVPGDQRIVLRDRYASAEAIGVAADWLVANAGPDATAVFFYAGHARRHSAARHAIVGADGTTITDLQLRDRLAGLRARDTWIAIAACYGGGFDELVAPGRLLTAAADANHLAYENQSFGRSYMVEFMIRRAMIDGAATSSVQAAFAYAKAALQREYPNRAPFALDATERSIDLRQGRDPADRPPPQKAPSPPPTRDSSPADDPASDDNDPPSDGCAALTLGVVRCRD